MTQLNEQALYAIEVPEDAQPYILNACNNKGQGLFYKQPGNPSPPWIDLPPGNYSFLFCSLNCTEEQAASVVESEELFINGKSQGVLHAVYYNNGKILADVCEWYNSAKNSLQSLLKSKNLDPNKNYALVKLEQ
jgi:hypothetical protein